MNENSLNEIEIVKMFPGIDSQRLINSVDRGLDAFLLEGYGCGTLPFTALEKGIKYSIQNNVPIFLMAGINGVGKGIEVEYGSTSYAIREGVVLLEKADLEVQEELLRLMQITPKEDLLNVLVNSYCLPNYWKRMKQFTDELD